jgi:hypothetical protein
MTRDFPAFKRKAIRYWERRRIIYNIALVPPALLSFLFFDNLNWVGDSHQIDYGYLLVWFGLSALGANVCYSFAYAFEFLFGSDDRESWWMTYGRTVMLVGGVLLAMLLALIGGHNIANLDYHHS